MSANVRDQTGDGAGHHCRRPAGSYAIAGRSRRHRSKRRVGDGRASRERKGFRDRDRSLGDDTLRARRSRASRGTWRRHRNRSQRIVMEVCGVSRDEATNLLERAGKSVKLAIVMQKKGVSRQEAEKLLAENGGVIRRVTKDAPPPIRES